MKRRLLMTWALVAGPFFLSAATGGPVGIVPHAIFHPVYLAFTVGALIVLVRFRSQLHSPVARGLAIALIVAQVGSIVGHIGEEISVLRHGGLQATEAVFDEPFHLWSSWITVPSLLLSQLLLIALTIAVVVAGRAARRRPAIV